MSSLVQMSFRCTPEKREEIRALARKSGRSLGGFIWSRATAGSEHSDFNVLCIRSALRWLAREKPIAGPFWQQVAHVFGLGSTSAENLCNQFGFDIQTGEEKGAAKP